MRFRFDQLPEVSPNSPPDLRSILMYAYFSRKDFWQYSEMSTEYVDKVAKENFLVESLNHSSTKEWRLNGDTYTAAGWSYTSACFYELVNKKSYRENEKNIDEVVLKEYSIPEYEFNPIDFVPVPGRVYSEPMEYVIEQKGDEMRNGMSTIDAIKGLITQGDTSHFINSGKMITIEYYIDGDTGNMVFTNVKFEWE